MEHEVGFSVRGEARHSIRIADGTVLIDAVIAAGLPIARACDGDGLCARCGLRVLEGLEALSRESREEVDAKQRNRVSPELRLACQTRVRGDLLVTAEYW